jgi:hypothetical protein
VPFSRSTPSLETALEVGRLPLKTMLSDPYVDVAPVGVRETRVRGSRVRETRLREPRFVELDNEIGANGLPQ